VPTSKGVITVLYALSERIESGNGGSRSVLLSKTRRSGVAAAEFALLAPFLVFVIIGVVENARGIMMKQMLNDAARKACRTGVLPGKTNSDITSDVNNILSDNNISNSSLKISILIKPSGATDVSGAQPGVDIVSVKVSLPVSSFYWAGTYFLPASDVESETISMLKQG
jgi:Flp pilus assembly pilin Flp